MENSQPNSNRKNYFEFLRQMTPQQRWDKAFELTDRARSAYRAVLAQHYPELSEKEFADFYRACRGMQASMSWSPEFEEEFLSGKV